MSWIVTRSGKEFDLLDPQPDMIEIQDIAHSLSRIERFNGHTIGNKTVNVALHSLMVAYDVHPGLRMSGLLHDAHEAYIGDISTPVKKMLGHELKNMEYRIQAAIAEKFNYDMELGAYEIKKSDIRVLRYERDNFMKPGVRPWGGGIEDVKAAKPSLWLSKCHDMQPNASKLLFLRTFKQQKESKQ